MSRPLLIVLVVLLLGGVAAAQTDVYHIRGNANHAMRADRHKRQRQRVVSAHDREARAKSRALLTDSISAAAHTMTSRTRGDASARAVARSTQRNSLCSGRPSTGLTRKSTVVVSLCAR